MAQSSTSSEITKSRSLLCNPYAHLDEEGGFSAITLRDSDAHLAALKADRLEKQNPYAHDDEITLLATQSANSTTSSFKSLVQDSFVLSSDEQRMSDAQIEQRVERLKRLIWKCREEIWGKNCPTDPVKLLDASRILEQLGFEIERHSSLGTFLYRGQSYEVSGEIDRDLNKINVSEQEHHISRTFTLAHELGHAVMHAQSGLHRDPRPKDREDFKREHVEKEADKFASLFLMPEKLVRSEFRKIFMVDKFSLTEARYHALNPSNNNHINAQIESKRGLARFLAKTESYNGEYFESLADRFNVSTEAMAIRLEELKIV